LSAGGHHGLTALHFAAGTENEDMVNMLVHHGASPEAKCNDGWSPLAFGYYAGEYRTFILLLKADLIAPIQGSFGYMFFCLREILGPVRARCGIVLNDSRQMEPRSVFLLTSVTAEAPEVRSCP
jgi:hypothetical protein